MNTIELGPTGRSTTRLGFGCSSLMGAMGRRESLAVLEAAFDAGIRHFDVAPMYGFGQAEACLGEFHQAHRGAITMTTKYGIPAPEQKRWMGLARRVAKPIVRMVPGLKQRMVGVASKAIAHEAKASFTAAEARASLEQSLMNLRTERVDVWLLHDAAAEDLHDEGLLRFMEDAVKDGKVGAFGVGTDREKIPMLLERCPEFCGILQFEWSVKNEPVGIESFMILHRALSQNFQDLKIMLEQDAALCARWSDEVGADLANGETLAALMLKAALVENSKSIVLCSSKKAAHIRQNAKMVEDRSADARARKFYSIVQRDMPLRAATTRSER